MDKYTVKKVPIYDFIIDLQQAYDMGADFIDMTLIHKGEDDRDEIIIDIQEDYYCDEEDMNEEGDTPISDIDDVNKLIG